MKRTFSVGLMASAIALMLGSCAGDAERKPVGPTTKTSRIPWNQPIAGQGQGQMGMLPQSQYRR